jgi:hypothetical protein
MNFSSELKTDFIEYLYGGYAPSSFMPYGDDQIILLPATVSLEEVSGKQDQWWNKRIIPSVKTFPTQTLFTYDGVPYLGAIYPVYNAEPIEWTANSYWGIVKYIVIRRMLGNDWKPMFWGELDEPVEVHANNVFRIPAGGLKITIS